MQQIAEEGGASVFKPIVGSEWIVGVVGTLQFEVMADRIKNEFNIPVMFEPTQYYTARWVECPDKNVFEKFRNASQLNLAEDHDGELVFLARNAWHLGKVHEDFPEIVLKKPANRFSENPAASCGLLIFRTDSSKNGSRHNF